MSTAVADDVPLIRSGIRMAWLRVLGALGVKRIVGTSGLGYQFVCHIGDLAEYPFYYRHACENELVLAATWLEYEDCPTVYDVGANVGFFATHLVQMLAGQSSQIFAFEAVPTTYVKLVQSVQRLGLDSRVHPVAAAVLDVARPVRMSFSDKNSLESQISGNGEDQHDAKSAMSHVAGLALDDFHAFTGDRPALVKIDVEGGELDVLRGARRLLADRSPPALMLEYHPTKIAESSKDARALDDLLFGYSLYYVDDLEGRLPFGMPITALAELDWICNLFAVPKIDALQARWEDVSRKLQRRLQ